MSRKPARGQKLPPQEVELLNSLSADALIVRVHALYTQGWSLQAIGEDLQPPRPRTTIRSWVLKAPTLPQKIVDAPIPEPKTVSSAPRPQKKTSKGIPPTSLDDIKHLAPLARTFRSKMASTSAAAIANSRLTELCQSLYNSGVQIKDLAAAANVTYRAMYKRIKL